MAYTYSVSISSTVNGPWVPVDSTAGTTDTISNLTPGQTYYFQIVPMDRISLIQGPPVVYGPVSTTLNPTAPTNLQVTGIQQYQVTLNWSPSI